MHIGLCYGNSVVRRPTSVTHMYCIKTAKPVIEILSLSDRPVILIFRHQGLLRKSDCYTPKRGAEYRWVATVD